MGPTLLIDKSVIYGLKVEETWALRRYFNPLITPILMQEILSELAKKGTQEELQKNIAMISYKTQGMNSYSVVPADELVVQSLLGENVPMTGQVPMPGGTRYRTKDGSYGVFFGESEESRILRRWQAKQFEDDEEGRAKKYREENKGESIARLREFLQTSFKELPKLESMQDAVDYVDKLFQNINKENLIHAQMLSFQFSDNLKARIMKRLSECNSQNFEQFAPYAYFHLRLSYIYNVSVAAGLVKLNTSSNSYQDLQYLFYLPFCHGIASDDGEQIKLAKTVIRKNQFVITKSELKGDFQKLVTNPTDRETRFLNKAWETSFNTTKTRSEEKNRIKQRSRDQSGKDVKEIMERLDDSYDVENNRMFKKKKSLCYESLNLYERYDALYEKMFDIFNIGSSEDAILNLNKTITEEQVKDFHSLYGDIFPPDTDLSSIVKTSSEMSSVLYSGDIDIYRDYKKIVSNLSIVDCVYLIDPIQNPWSKKKEYNPVADPYVFMADTLKVVHYMFMLYPLFLCDRIRFVPDIFEFHIPLREKLFEICKKKNKGIYSEAIEEDDEFKEIAKQDYTESIARFSDEQLKIHFSNGKREGLPDIEVEELIKFVRSEARKSPSFLDQEMKAGKGSIIIKRSGCNFEASLLNSSFLKASPSSFQLFRRKEFKVFSDSLPLLEKLNNILNDNSIKLFSGTPNSFSVIDVLELIPYVQLRALFGEIREVVKGQYLTEEWVESTGKRYLSIRNDIEKMISDVGVRIKEVVPGLDFRDTIIQIRFIQDVNQHESVIELSREKVWNEYMGDYAVIFFDLSYS